MSSSSTSGDKRSAASSLVPVKTSPRNQPKFQEGEKVLCYHGSLLYEAKCLKVDTVRSGEFLYFIHYNGWSKNWDEWVPLKRVLKLNEENLKKQEELIVANRYVTKEIKDKVAIIKSESKSDEDVSSQSSSTSNQAASTSSSCRVSTRSQQNNLISPSNPNLRKRHDPTETSGKRPESKAPEIPKKRICIINIQPKQNSYHTAVNARISMPEALKEWLIDDFDAINQQNKLIKLPVSKTVVDLLNDFYAFKTSQPQSLTSEAKNALKETNAGLVKYFDVMLGSQLLYKFERVQYTEILAAAKPMSEVYGAFHFLRLLEKMEQILAFTPLEPKSLETLINHVNSMLVYLDDKNKELFSIESYVLAPPDYVRSAI